MKGLPFVLAFTAMTFIAWGAYGPLLHHGTLSMGNDSLRAFVGVGIAYFFIAVLVPIYILRSQGEAGKWTISGTFYSLIAGSVGALGALGVILALAYGGSPIYVMPLVFGFAPIVNTLVTAWMSKTFDQISPIFIGGIVVAALGVAGVLAFKPAAPPHAAHPTKDAKSKDHDDKQSAKPDHSALEHRSSFRFVSSALVQEPQDPLPPVVVQPPAPEPTSPAAPSEPSEPSVAPQAEPAQPAPPADQPIATPEPPQELPPVVVQPVAPETNVPAPAPTTPAAPAPVAPAPVAQEPAAPAAQEPAAELPPVVVQPAPLTDTKTPTVTPNADTPKVDAPKPEPAKPEPAKPEPAKPEAAKPEAAKPEAAKPESTKPEPSKERSAVSASAKLIDEQIEDEPKKDDEKPSESKKSTSVPDVPMIILSIIVAAVCWGSYGPMLHQGQARMGGSRLRPFTCVGLAYFFIAVAAPLAVIYARTADSGSWSVGGLSWSIVAGAAGAIGALGVILAFNAGGKPYYVMPLVFGFAPVINTCISLTEKGTWGLATPMFWISLAVVIAGAITVLLNAPKPKHAKPT
ncbi:MAG: hypothetical protein SFV81_11345 [Pirellulaceae bacterium]|nr:hypothetical protein [Pirellulaceae bacterium]